MSDKLRQLSEEALHQLKEVVDDWLSRNIGASNRPNKQIENDHQAADTYIAYTPADGIPAMTEETYTGTSSSAPTGTGSATLPLIIHGATCDLYRISAARGSTTKKQLTKVNLKQFVYNPSLTAIEGGVWVSIDKTKAGFWIVPNDGKDSGDDDSSTDDLSSTCAELASLRPRDCVRVTGLGQSKILSHTDGSWSSRYVSDADGPTGTGESAGYDLMTYPGGSGTLSFYYDVANARYRLLLDGKELTYCGNGCFSGGYYTGHVPENYPYVTGTGSGSGSAVVPFLPCDGYSFLLCVSCHCCPVDGWERPAWYCVEVTPAETGTDGEGQVCEALYVDEDDACLDIVICSGPYDTQEEAEVDCGGVPEITFLNLNCCGIEEPLPNKLKARIRVVWDNGSIDKYVTITYRPAAYLEWANEDITLVTGTGYVNYTLVFQCRPDLGTNEKRIFFTCDDPGSGSCGGVSPQAPFGCDPIEFHGSGTINPPCFTDIATVTIDIEEYPTP